MRDEEKSQRPRRLIHNAQRQVIKWQYYLRRARRGNVELGERRAAEELHDATMIYYEQIKRFRESGRIAQRWQEKTAVEVDGSRLTLDDLGDRRLDTKVQMRTKPDPETMGSKRVTDEQPWTLAPRQCLRVVDALDDCANALGFDAQPARDADATGAGLNGDGSEDIESMEYLNETVEVGHGDD